MKNYEIMAQDGLPVIMESTGARVIKLSPKSHVNIAQKNRGMEAKPEAVKNDPNFEVVDATINGSLGEIVSPKKIKVKPEILANAAFKGKVKIVTDAQVESISPTEKEDIEIGETKPMEEDNHEFPHFDFGAINFHPTVDPEDEKEPIVDNPLDDKTKDYSDEIKETTVERPNPILTDSTIEFNANNLREALKAKLSAVQKETQEKNEEELKKAREAFEDQLKAKEQELMEKERKLDETSAALERLQRQVSEITSAANKKDKELAAYKEVFSELVDTKEAPTMKRVA